MKRGDVVSRAGQRWEHTVVFSPLSRPYLTAGVVGTYPHIVVSVILITGSCRWSMVDGALFHASPCTLRCLMSAVLRHFGEVPEEERVGNPTSSLPFASTVPTVL